MKTHTTFAGVAVATLLLAMTPAGAVTLNIGGSGGIVSLGSGDSGSSGAEASVGVDADVDIELNVLDGGGDGDAALELFGSQKPLLRTGGDSLVTVDTEDNSEALVTLFGGSGGELLEDQAVEVDLFEADREDEVVIRLFGTGESDSKAAADLGGRDAGAFGPDAGTMELFGAGSDDFGGPDDGSGVDDTQTGSVAASPEGAADDGIAPAPAPQRLASARAGTRIAATGGGSARGGGCFSPNQAQIAHLLGRSDYEPADVAGWQQAERVSLVPINLCADAKARLDAALAADPDIEYLRSAVAEDPTLSSQLDPSYAPDDVLAVDQSGEEVTVYVTE